LQTLKEIDPARGDRLDDKPEVEVGYSGWPRAKADRKAMYQDSVKLQGQINALIKKYSDQKGEL
jgi:signal transducing adaptor molecule